MKTVYMAVFALSFIGCGDASEPRVEQTVEIKKETVIAKKPEEKTEVNNSITHIRVLAIDEGSKIPEYLVKLPIQTN